VRPDPSSDVEAREDGRDDGSEVGAGRYDIGGDGA